MENIIPETIENDDFTWSFNGVNYGEDECAADDAKIEYYIEHSILLCYECDEPFFATEIQLKDIDIRHFYTAFSPNAAPIVCPYCQTHSPRYNTMLQNKIIEALREINEEIKNGDYGFDLDELIQYTDFRDAYK